MEFREYYRGIELKIRFDSHAGAFTGETDGLPEDAVMHADSYDNLHTMFRLSVDDYLSGRHAKLEEKWVPHAALLDEAEMTNESRELEKAMAEIAAGMAEKAEEHSPFQGYQPLRKIHPAKNR